MSFRVLGPKGHIIVRAVTHSRLLRILPGLRRRFGRVFVSRNQQPPRQRLVAIARQAVVEKAAIHYTETAARTGWLRSASRGSGRIPLPLNTDCSGAVTLWYFLAGLDDPNGLGYGYLGYTGTLLDHAYKHGRVLTDVSAALPGDLVVYGPGTGWHVAMVVEAGFDPLTVSHGQESDPSYCRVSQDGRHPQRVCRYL